MQDNQYSEKLKLSELQVFNPVIRSWAVQGFRINLVGTIFRKICMSSTFNQVFLCKLDGSRFFALVFWNSETFNIHCCLVSGGPSSRVGWRYSLTFLLLSWTVLLFVDLYDLLRLVSGGWVSIWLFVAMVSLALAESWNLACDTVIMKKQWSALFHSNVSLDDTHSSSYDFRLKYYF